MHLFVIFAGRAPIRVRGSRAAGIPINAVVLGGERV